MLHFQIESTRYETIIWVNIKASKQLQDLKNRIDGHIALDSGIKIQNRKFKPHITIGRAKNTHRQVLEQYQKEVSKKIKGEIAVESFTIFKSTLSSQGVRHMPLKIIKLEGD